MIKKITILLLGNIKLFLIKVFNYNNFKYHLYNNFDLSSHLEINRKSRIILGRKFIMRGNGFLAARKPGNITIGDNVFINRNCYVVCHKEIIIGNNVSIGPNTIIVDHDHKFDSVNGVNEKEYKTESIIIESGVWIGSNCVILKGTRIGKNSVIGAGSIVNFDVPDNTILVQKKNNKFKKIK